ncbi:MAG: DUF4439 domain-containing protein [Micromonosporaceae bacterium]|nr:DUF4439 domain-containing protein [Micromonosporaceae bacterium]
MPDPTRLADALAAEHAAIFAYGLIGVELDGKTETEDARDAEAAHRLRRDALVQTLADREARAPVAEASYELPFEVAGAEAARRLAVLVEERVGAVWRAALPAVTGDDRAQALDALVDTALRATGWRLAAGVEPATTAFPGAPG